MKHWTEITIADVLSSVNEIYSSRHSGGKDEASLKRMTDKLNRVTECDRSTVERWMTGRSKPRKSKLSAQQLKTFLYDLVDDRKRKIGGPSVVEKLDKTFVEGMLSALEKRGYDVTELKQDGREPLCEKLATAARATADSPLKQREETQKAERKAGIPPKKPLLAQGDLVEEGTMIDAPHPCFPKREDHGADLFGAFCHSIRTPGGRHKVPYKELFGHQGAGRKEYTEGKNLVFSYEDYTVDYASRVTSCDFAQARKEKEAAAAQMGYTVHPPKLCLVDYLEERAEDACGGETRDTLRLVFGTSHYLENLVWRDELQRNPVEQESFRQVLASSPKEHLAGFDHGPWAAAGGGTWVITSDGYLVMSFRSPTRVGEVAGRLGYSASGSYGRYTTDAEGVRKDQTPGGAMVRELEEELGLPQVKPEELVQISLGLDLGRGLAQWSYLLESEYSADDVAYYRQDWATTADEQTVFFVPLDTPDVCYRLLAQCEFEPGAAFSLYRLLTKRFGPLGR